IVCDVRACVLFFFSSRRRHTRFSRDWSSDVCSSDLNIKGIEVVNEDHDFVWIQAQAGEIWHEFVLNTVDKNLGGLENLSLIPGRSEERRVGKECRYRWAPQQ